MKRIRKSYIEESKNNMGFASKLIISLLVVINIVLLLMVFLSNIIGLYEVSREPSIAKQTLEANVKYGDLKAETQKLASELAILQSAKLKKDEGQKFYESIIALNDIRITISQKLRSALDKKGFLKEKGDYIYVNKTGNLTILDSLAFKEEQSLISDNVKDGIVLLSRELEAILDDKERSRFIKHIAIESFVSDSDMEVAKISLASQRANNFLMELLNANESLKEKYSNKFISSNCYNNSDGLEDSNGQARIEISVYIDDAAIAEGMEKFFEDN